MQETLPIYAMTTTLDYPHTSIQARLFTLANTLDQAGQSYLATEARGILTEYQSKRAYWTARVAELELAQPLTDGPDAPSGDSLSAEFPETVRSLPGYPHTRILVNIATLHAMMFAGNAESSWLELLESIESDYLLKKAFLFRTIDAFVTK